MQDFFGVSTAIQIEKLYFEWRKIRLAREFFSNCGVREKSRFRLGACGT